MVTNNGFKEYQYGISEYEDLKTEMAISREIGKLKREKGLTLKQARRYLIKKYKRPFTWILNLHYFGDELVERQKSKKIKRRYKKQNHTDTYKKSSAMNKLSNEDKLKILCCKTAREVQLLAFDLGYEPKTLIDYWWSQNAINKERGVIEL